MATIFDKITTLGGTPTKGITPTVTTGSKKSGSIFDNITTLGNQTGGISNKKFDLNTVEGLREMAISKGLGDQVSKIMESQPKLGMLQRLGAAVGAFGTANAVKTGMEKGLGAGVLQYGKDIFQGLGSAITGTDYGQTEKATYSDILAKEGVTNSVAKYGIGFIGDILLDPSTYFGGAIIKGALKGTKFATGLGLKAVEKVAPEAAAGLKMTGEGIKDAFGNAFKFAYKTSEKGAVTGKSMAEVSLEYWNKLGELEQKALVENMDRWGTGSLSVTQQKTAVIKLMEAKLAEYQVGKGTEAGAKAAQKVISSINDGKVTQAITEQAVRSKELYTKAVINKVFGNKLTPEIYQAVATKLASKVGSILPIADNVTPAAIKEAESLLTPSLLKKINTISQPFEYYWPSLKKDNVNEFVSAIMNDRKFYPGSQGYLKQFKNLITKEELNTSPVSVYAKRQFEIEKDLAAADFLNGAVKDFGKPANAFKTEAEALAEGFKPLYPKGTSIGFYKGEMNAGEDILKQIKMQEFSQGATLPQVLEQSFTKVGKAIQFAEEAGLNVSKLNRGTALGKATLGGIEKGGAVQLKAFISDTIAHELGHSFDTGISKIINTQKVFQKELTAVTKFMGLGGSPTYQAKAVERFAEFVSLYIHNPQKAMDLAPEFSKLFENTLLPENKISELVSKLSDFFQKVDGLPNIKSPLKALDNGNYLETAIRKAFPAKEYVGVKGVDPIGWLPKTDVDFINGLMTKEITSFDKIAKATGYDAMTALFKRSVTGLFAPFHLRNYVSGIIQNFEVFGIDSLNPKYIGAGQKMALNIAQNKAIPEGAEILVQGKKFSLAKVYEAFRTRFGSSSSYASDIKNITQDVFEETLPGSKVSSLAKTIGKYTVAETAPHFKAARAVGNFIETQQKATGYLVALSQGKSIEEALKLAGTAGFDYRAITQFESKIMKRIVPFYSFTRKNIELQLKTLKKNPERINQIIKFFQSAGGVAGGEIPPEERRNLPDYIKNSLGIKWTDTPEGLKRYIYSLGSPIEAFTQLLEGNPVLKGISMMNPLLKAPLEIGVGKDSFRMKDLKDVYDAQEYSWAPQAIKDLLDITEVDKPILKMNPVGKLVETGQTRKVYVADPVKLLIARSLFTSRGVSYLDSVFDGDFKDFLTYSKLLTGIKPTTVDIEAVASIKERDQERALQDLLIKRTADVRSFQNVYQNK